MSGRVYIGPRVVLDVSQWAIEEIVDATRRQAFAEVAALMQAAYTPGSMRMARAAEDMATNGIEVRPEALGVCAKRPDLERYCPDRHCDRCLSVRELDDRYGREVTSMALQRARAEGIE